MVPETELWRKYLRRDPTRFLLDPDANPSVSLWYLIDIARRPEDSTVVKSARELVLYSSPVQEILAAQHPDGYWGTAGSLSRPYYAATLWKLALLAELGIPRESRRARSGCEHALANFLDERGHFAGLDLVESAFLIHALSYFRLASDARAIRAARGLVEPVRASGSMDADVMALWAWSGFDDPETRAECGRSRENLLAALERDGARRSAPITFPQFDPRDALFVCRVLALQGGAADPRSAPLIELVIGKQNEQGQWPLEKVIDGGPAYLSENVGAASRWATLNALRIIVELVRNVSG